MEICVNEYVRTKNGYIARLKEKSENCWNFDNTIIDSYTETSLLFGEDNCYGYDQRENIIKHSKSIIDLIEEGDYVNGYKVVKDNLESAEYGKYVDVYCPSKNLELNFLEHVFPEHIKTILTKEQYEQNSYKIGE